MTRLVAALALLGLGGCYIEPAEPSTIEWSVTDSAPLMTISDSSPIAVSERSLTSATVTAPVTVRSLSDSKS